MFTDQDELILYNLMYKSIRSKNETGVFLTANIFNLVSNVKKDGY